MRRLPGPVSAAAISTVSTTHDLAELNDYGEQSRRTGESTGNHVEGLSRLEATLVG